MQLNTDYLNGCESEHKMNELFSYALDQQPWDDAVSRKAVLKKIDYEVEHYCKYLEEVDDKRNAQTHVALVSDNIREEVEHLPPVTPHQKYGKWINGDCEGGTCSIYEKYYAFYPESGDFNYCPNCGAKMESENEK